MKKRQVFGWVVAGLFAATVSSALGQEAYSANAIGVIKKTVPAKGYAFLSLPLDSTLNADLKFSETPFMDLSAGSSITIWDVTNSVWNTTIKTARGGWGSFSNQVIQVGQPLFVYNYSSSDYEAIFSGEVPTDANLSVAIPAKGYQTIANPYPVPFVWGTSAIASNAAAGSSATCWDNDSQAWKSNVKTARGGWSSFATNTINPGEGIFFYEYGSDGYQWTVSKPYSWPN